MKGEGGKRRGQGDTQAEGRAAEPSYRGRQHAGQSSSGKAAGSPPRKVSWPGSAQPPGRNANSPQVSRLQALATAQFGPRRRSRLHNGHFHTVPVKTDRQKMGAKP